ncbi:MCE family protein [Nocardia aobensis]|uniref:MCE family protein n=1 Tax=Nocardia aobensis TaxID=257277 RepID=A0ABW6NZL8_9NOCA
MNIDPSGRGPGALRLGIIGVTMVGVLAAGIYLLGLRYTGAFADTVAVTAEMTSTGDGMPPHADVKFRGMIVGSVADVDIAAKGQRQLVRLHLKPSVAQQIPSTVTARVVPANLFGVTALELVDNGPGRDGLRTGTTIREDTSAATAQLQATLTTLRTVLDAIQPQRLARVLETLADALDADARVPGSTIERLDTWTTQVRAIPGIGDMLGNFGAAATAVNRSAPELIEALGDSVTAARTLTERRAKLVTLLTDAGSAVAATNGLFARNPDAGKELVSGLDDVFGAVAADPDAIGASVANLNQALSAYATIFTWGAHQQMQWAIDVTFTPFRPYTAADCPHYGQLAGPRCGVTPNSPAPQEFPPQLLPGRIGPAAPGTNAPAGPTLPWLPGLPPIPGPTAPAGPAAEGPPAPTPSGPAAPASYTGTAAITALLGREPNPAQLLLLRPVLADGAVTVRTSPPSNGGR